MSIFPEQRFRILISIAKKLIQCHDSIVMARQNDTSFAAKPLTRSFQSITIPHHNRSLEAVYAAPPSPSAAILLFHGIGDRLLYWQAAQTLLAEHNVASLVFHYSGYGRSTGATTPRNLHQDAHAAYATLQTLLPKACPISLLGFSLGSGIATDVASHLSPPPTGLILCQSFTSLRLAAGAFAPRALSHLLPDIWQTHRTIVDVPLPLLIVHGDADKLFPTSMSQSIEIAARARSGRSVQLIQPAGVAHNEPYARPTLDYWRPIIDFALQPRSVTLE